MDDITSGADSGATQTATNDSTVTETSLEGGSAVEQSTGADYVGFTPEQPAKEESATDGAAQFEIEDPNAIIPGIKIDGKEVTANDLKSGFMRYGEWTQKHQEYSNLVQYQENTRDAVEFVHENREILQKLGSEDTDQVWSALQEIAQRSGIDLDGKTRARDANGRFAKASDDLLDPEKFEDDDAIAMAKMVNEERQARRSLESRLDKFEKSITTQQQRQENEAALSKIAGQWSGVQGVDIEAARQLIGKPIGPKEAMMIAGWGAVMQHNVKVAYQKALNGGKQPDEPRGQETRGEVDPKGMSIEEYGRRAMRG